MNVITFLLGFGCGVLMMLFAVALATAAKSGIETIVLHECGSEEDVLP